MGFRSNLLRILFITVGTVAFLFLTLVFFIQPAIEISVGQITLGTTDGPRGICETAGVMTPDALGWPLPILQYERTIVPGSFGCSDSTASMNFLGIAGNAVFFVAIVKSIGFIKRRIKMHAL